jgi:endonuclease/exonuclease/phosphatase (EEP) superfamily protein YafD
MSEAAPRAKFSRLSLRGVTAVYAVLLLILLLAMEWRAESWLPLGILIFAPPILLLLPLVLLLPLAIWKRRWFLVAAHTVCVAMVLFGFMRIRLGAAKPASDLRRLFTAVTHNIGQGNREAFVDFFPDANPDAILLQDVRSASHRQEEYMHRYPAYRAVPVEPQFVLLTGHPVESATPVKEALWHGKPIAARFVLNVRGEKIALYSVHLPTPRRSLAHVFTGRALLEILWLSQAPTDGFPSYREWLDARVALARDLAAVLEKERLPFLVGGDFNMPDHGVLYHTFASRFTDAHAAVGGGFGMTFPGTREGGIPALLGPWLRLDYWFAGHGWSPVECRVAADDRSQHRAVLARFATAR